MANKEKLIASAQKFMAKGQLPKAVSEYQKLVASFPKDVRNRQKLAELLSRADQIDAALSEYEIVAASYTETGFYLKAIAVYKQMQKLEPSRVEFFSKLAELNVKQGLIGNALSEYRGLVTFYEQNGLAVEAIPVLEKMLELDAANLNFRAKIAEILFSSDRTDEGIGQFKLLVDDLLGKSEYVKIVKLYDRFHNFIGDDIELRQPLADSLLASGQSEKAIQLYKKLLKNIPEDPNILTSLALGYSALGDYENARLTCQHLLKVTPLDLNVREMLIRICLTAGDVEKALENLEECKDEFSQAERLPVLRDFYEEVRRLAPDDDRALQTLSEIYALIGDEDRPDPVAVQTVVSPEEEQIDVSVSVDSAIDDVETLDIVGEDVVPPGGVPSLVKMHYDSSSERDRHQAPELELDLDLDTEQEHSEGSDAEIIFSESDAHTPLSDQPPPDSEDAEETEVELEFELDSLGNLVMDGLDEDQDVDADSQRDEDLDVEGTETTESELQVPVEVTPDSEPSPDDTELVEFEAPDEQQGFEPQELDEIEGPQTLEEVEELEELEELEEAELSDSPDEIEELIPLEESDHEVAAVNQADVAAGAAGEEPELDVSDIPAELEEVTFYLHQGLYDEAERIVLASMALHGETPELTAKLAEINEGRHVESEEDTMDFSDLMSEMNDDELLGAADFLDGHYSASVDSDSLTQELASELDSTDTESHYNLGIAYKEMGLYDDAIAEFDKAALDPVRSIDCLTLKGQSALEMGDFELAEQTLKQGLALQGLSQEGRVTLYYELGLLYRVAGRPLEALESFQVVADHDLFFRDVGEIVKELRDRLGLDEATEDGDKAQGNRDRISYV